MKIPMQTKENLIELARTIKEFQIRHDLICDTLAAAAGVVGQWAVYGQYDEILAAAEQSDDGISSSPGSENTLTQEKAGVAE